MYLLSTDALLDILSGPDSAVLSWLSDSRIPPEEWSVSAISLGQARVSINRLADSKPSKAIYLDNINGQESNLDSRHAIRDVDIATVSQWVSLMPLDLQRADGRSLGPDSKLVIACALAKGLTLVILGEDPWVLSLQGRGLQVVRVLAVTSDV